VRIKEDALWAAWIKPWVDPTLLRNLLDALANLDLARANLKKSQADSNRLNRPPAGTFSQTEIDHARNDLKNALLQVKIETQKVNNAASAAASALLQAIGEAWSTFNGFLSSLSN